MLVTLIEGTALYAWLRIDLDGPSVPGVGVLIAGELLETLAVALPLRAAESPIAIGDPFGAGRHRRRFERRFGVASLGEILIWVGWLWVATTVDEVLAAGALLVLMHLKHQLEATTVHDIGFFQEFWRGTVASAAEVAGAVACLALIRDGRYVLAAVALAAGFLVEHALLVHQLRCELRARDISVPRPRRAPLTRSLRATAYVSRRFPRPWRLVQSIGPAERLVNRLAIGALVRPMPPRPNQLSTMASYTSWASLTDRTYSGRHLPPSAAGARRHPDLDAVAALFLRDGEMEPCPRSTVLFASFAQWFVDGFLRTERSGPDGRRNTRRNESTHSVDLAQLYGFRPAVTEALRLKRGGRLRSREINGEEYPEYLFGWGRRKPRFRALPEPLGLKTFSRAGQARLFAMGADPVSLGFTAFNVLFLREHNRIARQLECAHPTWSDERLFQTARNVLVVALIRIVVEEYINHIAGSHFRFRVPAPGTFRKAVWFRPNWMAVEFDLLYRWHALIPPTLRIGETDLPIDASLGRTDVLTGHGLRAFMLSASAQRAGRISLFNTDPFLVASAESSTIRQGRLANLRGYNDYRELCRLPRLVHFGEFSTDERVGRRLHDLYDRVDDVEFYVGLFAEQAGPRDVLPPLMTAMVAFDAFTQVLTNPLLAPRVYGPETFSETGMEIIAGTDSLATVLRRNVPACRADDEFSLTWSGGRLT